MSIAMHRLRRLMLLAGMAGMAITVAVALLAPHRPAVRSPGGHLSLVTAGALIGLVGAFLVLGRAQRSHRREDLVLYSGLVVLALGHIAFGLVPAIAESDRTHFASWGAVVAQVLAAALFASAAIAPSRVTRVHPRKVIWTTLAALALVAAVALGVAVLGDALPSPFALSERSGLRFEGPASVVVAQLAGVVLYVVAAVGFARRTGERRDPFLEALAVGAVLAAAGRLNYAMFPSVLTGQLSAGDAFQLCWLLAVLAGAALDVRLAWQGATQAAVLEERRRIARDLHDGVAQELASVVRNLAYLDADDRFASRSRDAAKRGLVAARQAIAALSGPLERPLHEALSDTVRSVADREGGRVLVAVDRTASAGVAERQAVLLIASEAVTNALRHSGVREVRVELTRAPDLNLRVRDDGRGFDAAADGRNGSFGLRVMAERAESVGGRLRVVSVPGRGTLVELAL